MNKTCKHENILERCELCQLEEERDHALAGKEHFRARAEEIEKDRDQWAGMYALCNKREAEALARAEDAEARVRILETAVKSAMLNLGVPTPEYPSPIVEAVRLLSAALHLSPSTPKKKKC